MSTSWTGKHFNFLRLVTWRNFLTSRAWALAGDAAGQGAGLRLVASDCAVAGTWNVKASINSMCRDTARSRQPVWRRMSSDQRKVYRNHFRLKKLRGKIHHCYQHGAWWWLSRYRQAQHYGDVTWALLLKSQATRLFVQQFRQLNFKETIWSAKLWSKYLDTLECQIEGPACLFIFHFLPTWPKPIWPYPYIFSGVIWQPVLSLSLTNQLKP